MLVPEVFQPCVGKAGVGQPCTEDERVQLAGHPLPKAHEEYRKEMKEELPG